MPSSGSKTVKKNQKHKVRQYESHAIVPVSSGELVGLEDSDPRLQKREMKENVKNSSLVWRRGKFSSDELAQLEKAVLSWISDRGLSREEGFSQLLWGRDNNLNRVWCDIGQRSGLVLRNLENIRKAAIRHFISEKRPWTSEEKAKLKELQQLYGERSWKAIAKDLGRSLEDTQSMGKQMQKTEARKALKAQEREEASKKKVKIRHVIPVESEKFSEFERQILLAVRESSEEYMHRFPVHNIQWGPIAAAMNIDVDARRKLAYYYGEILHKCMNIVDKSNPNVIERFILHQLYLGIEGRLTAWAFCDLETVEWPLVCPFLTIKDAKAKALTSLKSFSSDFITSIRRAKEALNLCEADAINGVTASALLQQTLLSVAEHPSELSTTTPALEDQA